MRRSWRAWVLLGLAGLLSCTTETHYDLRGAEPDPDVEEMRRRMRVRLYRNDGNGGLASGDPEVGDLLAHVRAPCAAEFACADAENCHVACDAEIELCVAHELLTWATVPTQTEGLQIGQDSWTVPPQSPATNAALARQAFLLATDALTLASELLRDDAAGTTSCDLTGPLLADGDLSVGQALGATFVEAVDLAAEASRVEAAALSAVADAQFSDQRQIRRATKLAFALDIGSRSAGAHDSVGGDPGLGASEFLESAGFCPEPRLSPRARAALDLLRLSGLPPRVILDSSVSIEDLIFGGWQDPATEEGDALLLRLAVLLSAPHLNPLDLENDITVDQFLDGFGLNREAFLHARAHLANELRAFGGSLDATLPPVQVTASSSTEGVFELYSATRNPPSAPPAVYWTAMARYAAVWTGSGSDPGDPIVDTAVLSAQAPDQRALSTLLDAAATEAGALLADTDLDATARNILAGFAPDGQRRRSGRAQFCLLPDMMSRDLRVRVWSETFHKMLLVRGADGLRCAVEGTVHGAACDLGDYDLVGDHAQPSPAATASGLRWDFEFLAEDFTTANELDSPLYSAGNLQVVPVFVVQLRPDAGSEAFVPGSYAPVTGMFVPIEFVGAPIYSCATVSIAPEAEEAAAELIQPSTGYCAMAAQTCAGIPIDQPIPLENELTSDSGGAPSVESSWRHYLDVAMRSAQLADQLGEDLVRSGLEMDMRAEAAIDELEDICGVSINLGNLGELASSIGGTCSYEEPCSANRRCVQGRCVLDPVLELTSAADADPDAARLAACLGEDSTTPWVTLGEQPLCFWWDGSDPSTICADPPEGVACPFEADSAGSCDAVTAPAPLEMIESPAVPLGYFVFHEEPPPPQRNPDPRELPCVALSQLRTTTSESGRPQLIDRVLTDPLFTNREGLRQLADRLDWTPAPGDYSSIRFDGAVLFSTGDRYVRRESNRWPCAQAPNFQAVCGGTPISNPQTDVPLFCYQLDASACPAPSMESMPDDPYGTSRVHRARMNDLLARAVIAARIISGAGLSRVQFPYYPRTTQDRVQMVDPDSADMAAPNRPPLRSRAREHHSSDSATLIWYGMGGALLLDNNLDDPPAIVTPLFDMRRGTMYEVTGGVGEAGGPGGCGTSIPRGAEWSFCPYDLPSGMGCVEIFDDATDCDDPAATAQWYDRLASDRNLGMIIRAFGDASDGTDDRAVSGLWSRVPAGPPAPFQQYTYVGLIERMLRDQRGSLRMWRLQRNLPELTRYWVRTECGANGECNTAHPDVERSGLDCWTSWGGTGTTHLDQPLVCRDYVGCRAGSGFYEDCRRDAESFGLDFDETFDGNRAFIAPRGLTSRDIMNGMELLCEAARQDIPGGAQCGQAPEIDTVGDLFEAQAFLECQSAAIHNGARMAIFRNVPARAVALLQEGGSAGVYGTVGGEYAAAASELRAAFIELSDVATATGASVDRMAAEIGALRARVSSLGIQTEIADWQLASTVMNQVTSCALAVAGIWNGDVNGLGARGAQAGITCVNSIGQIGIAARITDLQQEQNELAVREALFAFEQNFGDHSRALSGADAQARAAIARLEGAVTRLQNLQRRGRRALSRALMLDSDPDTAGVEGAMGRQYNVNTVMRRRHNTLLRRYQEAHRNAIRTAFIAKLALEQRLGMSMDEMTDPMTLLDEPPRDWHMNICEMRGIDYDRIRDARAAGAAGREGEDAAVAPPEDYSGEFIGDYVRRLELVFESYSFDYPFQDGTDTSVMSLRDEVYGVRGFCPVEVPNLLYEAGQLDAAPTASSRVGWEVTGCLAYDEWPPTEPPTGAVAVDPPPSCLEVEPLALDDENEVSPLPPWHGELGTVGGYRLHFGQPSDPRWLDEEGDPVDVVTNPDESVAIRHGEDTTLMQRVFLAPGRYRFSFWIRPGPHILSTRIHVMQAIPVYDEGTGSWVDDMTPLERIGETYFAADTRDGGDPALAWFRSYSFFDVDRASWVEVGFRMDQSTPPGYRYVDVAGPMLEDVTGQVTGVDEPDEGAYPPRPFFNTGQTRTRDLQVCEDTTGVEMRRSAFRRGCMGLCPDGYGNCPGALEQHCFYETAFTLSPERLQRAGLLGGAGFAFGNFNYRVDNIGINVVGTGVRDCSSSATPSTCYSSGNVSYSIVHEGPYPVRNHRGAQFDAPLFTGRIERARAVAAERYLTNPLSSSDRGMIEPYLRHELRGRPLTGTYILRIWDDPGLVWSNVEDVQIVLNYRYWTRQE